MQREYPLFEKIMGYLWTDHVFCREIIFFCLNILTGVIYFHQEYIITKTVVNDYVQ